LGSFLNTFAFERLLPRLVERLWVAPRLDGILVNSRAAARLYRQNISGRVSIACIHNGVETPVSIQRAVVRQNLGIAEAEIAVVAVGRLVPVKGFGYLIGAWGQLAKNHPTASLHLIGDGPMMGELRRAARDLGSAARVVFHGELSEPREVLPAFDVFVMPSLSEGFPNALLEGLAAGLPCVATRVGGIPEVGQKAGLSLIPPADPTALARAMSTLLADEEERRRRGKLARDAVVDRFPMRRMINKTIRWYQKALAAGDNEQ
jgi:glycosyltransferase involved in cell wall biosynthesis